ncbi:PHD finger protein 5a isoform X1 [Lasioglossum baleicum]|uniref:PHD finger protein 5a isoform X1 n=1 Tax=Lasioglossum baleicum TaxID=434251 RepID=UPI003FCDA4A0
MAAPGRRSIVTVDKRVELVKKLEEGSSVDSLAIEYGISRRTVRRYKQQAVSLKQFNSSVCVQTKRRRKPSFEKMEIRLYEWVLERTAAGVRLTNALIREKAKALIEELGTSSNFTASQGWISRFKARYKIRLSKPDKVGNTDEMATSRFIEDFNKMLEEENIEEDNIYNMDETSLLWKAVPWRTLVHKGEQPAEDRKTRKEIVTVALCANATGTHKLPLLFIHKYAKPRAFKHIKQDLPVIYKHQRCPWVNAEVFTDWYVNHFKHSVREFHSRERRVGKVLLLVDNFRGHVIPKELPEDENFKFMYLPPNTTSLIQPLELGIIAKCKRSFRASLLREILRYPGGLRAFYVNYDIKDCIDYIAQSWSNNITSENIRNSWKKLLQKRILIQDIEAETEHISIAEQIRECQSANMNGDEITEWIKECEEEESIVQSDIESAEGMEDLKPLCVIEEEETENVFHNLERWACCEPEYVRFHTKILIDYYNDKYHK